MSRIHPRLLVCDRLAIEDLGSANGMYVNGRAVVGIAALCSGDLITLGATTWRVESRPARQVRGTIERLPIT